MSSIDRVKAAVELREPDCVPVQTYFHGHAAKLIGKTYYEYCTSTRNLADAHIAAARKYDLDVVFVGPGGWVEASCMGAPVKYTRDSSPAGNTEDPFVKTQRDVEKLKFPNAREDGMMKMVVDASAMVVRELGSEKYVEVHIDQAPFSLAFELMGDRIYKQIVYDPDLVKKVLEYCVDVQVEYGTAIAETGAPCVMIGEPPSGLLSPKHYREFSMPYTRRVIEKMHDLDLTVALHICGNISHILDQMVETDADIIDVDAPTDLGQAKRKIGDRVCLMGNVDPVGVFLEGSPGDVEEAAIKCIKVAGENGGFILGAGCEVPRDTPPENIFRFVQTAREHGRYDRGILE